MTPTIAVQPKLTNELVQSHGRTIVPGFDYSVVCESVAEGLQRHASLIRCGLKQTATTVIEIGNRLKWAKEALGHGHFTEWLKAEFDWTDRTAQNYMRVAEVFGAKTETVSVLPPALLYRLAAKSTPGEVIDDVVEQLESGNKIDVRALEAKLAAARLQPLASSDGGVCRGATRASGRAVSPPDDALLRRIKNQKVTRSLQRRSRPTTSPELRISSCRSRI